MKYVCLIYCTEEELFSNSPTDAECVAFESDLRRSGHGLAGEALESVETSTVVRVRKGKLSVTDGPFAETKEQLAGFFLIDARDLNEAIQVASKVPAARVGSVEVRPVREFH